MGNWEALHYLKDAAEVALVSEETIKVKGVPLKESISAPITPNENPISVGKKLVAIGSRNPAIQPLAAVNLKKVGEFSDALNSLGLLLSKELDNQKSNHGIRRALRQTQKFPFGNSMWLLREMMNFADMGQFLHALANLPLAGDTQLAIQRSLNLMDQVIIAKYSTKRYEKTFGLSFQYRSKGFFDPSAKTQEEYERSGVPEWRAFIEKLNRPN